MSETISARFDPEALPEWAQRVPEVVRIAKRDLAFRCDVCRVQGEQAQRACVLEAKRRIEREENS